MTTLRTRLTVGALAVTLPLGAVVGCGAEKRRTVKAELTSAAEHLQNSQSARMTLSFKDDAGNLVKSAQDDETSEGLAKAMIGGSISYTIDPAGKQTLQGVQTDSLTTEELETAVKDVNVALQIRSDKADIAELRLVAGTVYARVDLKEIDRLSVLAGEEPFADDLDEMFGEDPDLSSALADVRAGKWLRLPITEYIERFKELAESFGGLEEPAPVPSASAGPDYTLLGERLFNAAKPHVTVTDAGDDSSKRVLNVKVQAGAALKAMLAALKASKDLPFAEELADIAPSEIDENVKDGTANGTITLEDSHLTEVTLDMESVRALDPTDDGPTIAGSHIVVGVDDDAGEVAVPTNVSSFDIGDMLEEFLDGLEGQQAA